MSERTVVPPEDEEELPAVGSAAAVPGVPTDERMLRREGLSGYVDEFVNRLRTGELGSLPVIFGLILIVIVFESLNSVFLHSFNLVSIAQFIAPTGIIATGVVLVLLLGEIDLSIGSVSGAAAAILAVLNVNRGLSPILAIVLALAGGAVIGLLHGLVFTRLGVPSFVVTLAGLLIWQGLQLRILGTTGSINLPPDGPLVKFGQTDNAFVLNALAYALAAVIAGLLFLTMLGEASRRRAAGLRARPVTEIAIRCALLFVVLALVVYVLSRDRGVPWTLVVFLALVVIVDFVLRRTRYGRAVYAIGGNIEAARRAGLPVDRIRISIFVLASTFAALGGVIGACYLGAVDQATGGGDTLVNSIAAAVIGGTSLFGGRGKAMSALLGMLVIGAITNGLLLQNLSSSLRYMITGTVLVASVVIDSLARRTRQSAGR
jgi:D-xylose transport system permease protein